jgi:putative endonuclease
MLCWVAVNLIDRHPEGRKRARGVISGRVALRDLAFIVEKLSYVYMMGSASRRALYTGVTGPLYKRVWEHKNNLGGYFTSKYKCHRLVYYETFGDVNAAIAREKEIKGWCREKKNKLVNSMNPTWKDLAANWYPKQLVMNGVPTEFGSG